LVVADVVYDMEITPKQITTLQQHRNLIPRSH
jgi:hypothetical protein